MLLADMLTIVVLCLLCELVAAVVFVKWVVMRYAGAAVIRRIKDPDEETREAIGALIGQILQSEIRTGRMLKDANDREYPESIPFVRYVGREIWNYLGQLRKASSGGKSTAIGAELDPMGMMGPRKGQSTTEYLMEQGITRLWPKIEESIGKKIEEKLNGQNGF